MLFEIVISIYNGFVWSLAAGLKAFVRLAIFNKTFLEGWRRLGLVEWCSMDVVTHLQGELMSCRPLLPNPVQLLEPCPELSPALAG